VLLRHITVHYFRCPECGFVRTEEANWLPEAYSRPITALDVGLLGRCLHLATITETFMRAKGDGDRCLDWAGGYGTLTRLMRDRGIDMWHHDPYTENLFAAGFEGRPEEEWSVTTMYEVLEHLPDPFLVLARLGATSGVLLTTTELLPDPPPRPGHWWYYAPETGQHISFYTLESLRRLASRLGMEVVSDGTRWHALYTPGALGPTARWIVRSRRVERVLRPLLRRLHGTSSLLQNDVEKVRQSLSYGARADGAPDRHDP